MSIPTAVDLSTPVNAALLNAYKAAIEDLEDGTVPAGSLDINGLSAIGEAVEMVNDTVPIYDASGAVVRKVAVGSLGLAEADHNHDGDYAALGHDHDGNYATRVLEFTLGTERAWETESSSWATSNSSASLTGTYRSRDANGAYIEQGVRVPESGHYYARICYWSGVTGALLNVTLDGASKLTGLDTYSNPARYNNWSELIDIGSLTAGTKYLFRITTSGRNPSNTTGYECTFMQVQFYRGIA